MGDYFECEIRLDDENETHVTTVNLRILPRIGEHISTVMKNEKHLFKVTDICHFAGDKMVGHRIAIYVRHSGK